MQWTGPRRAGGLAATFAAVCAFGPLAAQEAVSQPFLVLSQERILTGSATGQSLLAEEARARDALRAEARAIDAAFEAEERALTASRSELTPEEFRARADDFDARVVVARREQDERSDALAQEFDQKRREFYAAVAPVLVSIMEGRQADVILDENTVLLADQEINITDAVIAEIDARDRSETTPAQPGPGEGDQPR
jgi:Skp family chaperone for outer membrane proteins